MNTRHPKSVRRQVLSLLYERYMQNPLEMLSPADMLEAGEFVREELLSNAHYLHDRGLVELLMGYNPPAFAAARITASGIDLVENRFEFDLRFPPSMEELEAAGAEIPALLESLAQEAEYAALDGEQRQALIRDVQFLREEVARPAARWRMPVIHAFLDWIRGHFADAAEPVEESLPSLELLRQAIEGLSINRY